MADAKDVRMTGAARDGSAPLEQPTDAVKMEDRVQSLPDVPQSSEEAVERDPPVPVPAKDSPPAPVTLTSEATQTDPLPSTTSSKGKEKAVAALSLDKTDEDAIEASEESGKGKGKAPARLDSDGGPSTDRNAPPSPLPADGPVCKITLLLAKNGSRHPYRLDERYLRRRNVNIPGTTADGKPDPFSISIYTLKELIMREWRDEWDPKPTSPAYIRLIHFGKLLDDKDNLRHYNFSDENPNVIHLSLRPQELAEDEEPKGGPKVTGSGSRNSREGSSCCVIL